MEYPCRIGTREPSEIGKLGKEFLFEDDPHEILVAVSDENAAFHSMGDNGYSPAKLIILGYHDLTTGRKSSERARMDWFLTDYERESGIYKTYFEKLTVYRVEGFPAKILTEPPYDNPLDLPADSFNNPFRLGGIYVTEILEKDAQDEFARGLINAYLTPKTFHSEILGDLTYNSRRESFEGECDWLGNKISLRIYSKPDSKEFAETLGNMERLWLGRERWDRELREFAAKDMTVSANEWLADYNYDAEEKLPPITEEAFAKRIVLSGILTYGGTEFTAYFDDGGMNDAHAIFFGHTVTVDADLEKGCESADLMG